jgi:uncharacterized membrane protein YdjX (TVP38/TMEM64 family)
MDTANLKQFWKSKTLWGILIAVVPMILQVVGLPLPISEMVNDLLIALGGSLAAYGRVTATTQLKL